MTDGSGGGPAPVAGFIGYDNGWSYDDSFNELSNSWKSQSMPNIKLSLADQELEPAATGAAPVPVDSTVAVGQSSTSSYFDDIFNSLCRPEASAGDLDAAAAGLDAVTGDFAVHNMSACCAGGEASMPSNPPACSGWTDALANYTNVALTSSHSGGFQVQRPGNWAPLTVFSSSYNRTMTCVTFCNVLPRVSSIFSSGHC